LNTPPRSGSATVPRDWAIRRLPQLTKTANPKNRPNRDGDHKAPGAIVDVQGRADTEESYE